MRNPDRIDRIINKVRDFWKIYPDWRLGQLVSNIVQNDMTIFHIEDEDFEKRLEEWIERLKRMEEL